MSQHTESQHPSEEFDPEFEEITSEEVDRTVALLDRLAITAKSENIRAILENASNEIYYLMYEDEAETQGLDPHRHAA